MLLVIPSGLDEDLFLSPNKPIKKPRLIKKNLFSDELKFSALEKAARNNSVSIEIEVSCISLTR
jgi:hypothetical protein